jgi:hypothetical protein
MRTPWGFNAARDAEQRGGGADPLHEGGHAAAGLLPDFAAEAVAVGRDDVRVVELIGGVMGRLRCELSGTGDHVLNVLRGHPRPTLDGLDHVDLGAKCSQELEALL